MKTFIENLIAHGCKPGSRLPSSKVRQASSLKVEGLEQRWSPSCTTSITYFQDGTRMLSVTGSTAADTVTIGQDDDIGLIKVVCTGSSTKYFTNDGNLTKISINLGAGADVLDYSLKSDSFDHSKTININLGNGDDGALLNFLGTVTPAVLKQNLTMTANGGAGNDTIWALFGRKHSGQVTYTANGGTGDDALTASLLGDISGGGRVKFVLNGNDGKDDLYSSNEYDQLNGDDVDLADNCLLEIVMNGGNHDDKLYSSYRGELAGKLYERLDGQGGNDSVGAQVDLKGPNSGTVDAKVQGGTENDKLWFSFTEEKPDFANVVNAVLNGGLGTDLYDASQTTFNIVIQGCEGVY